MTCDFYEKYELGEINHSDFSKHLRNCGDCQRQISDHEQLLKTAKSLRCSVQSPALWEKIEQSLILEKGKLQRRKRAYSSLLRIAAVLILIFGVTVVWLSRERNPDSKLLADSALKKVEQRERELEAAISELEKVAVPELSGLDLELMFLYRERLETIDMQIVQCKEMLSENPANAHLRNYLLAAYKDKKETLSELIHNAKSETF